MSISGTLRRRSAIFALAAAFAILPGGAVAAQDPALEYNAPPEMIDLESRDNMGFVVPIVVPEPATFALLVSGMAALWLVARRRRRA